MVEDKIVEKFPKLVKNKPQFNLLRKYQAGKNK
jgi:hypothetical protein